MLTSVPGPPPSAQTEACRSPAGGAVLDELRGALTAVADPALPWYLPVVGYAEDVLRVLEGGHGLREEGMEAWRGAAAEPEAELLERVAGLLAPTPVSLDDIATLRQFLERRISLSPGARAHLATDLAARVRPKVVGAPDGWHPESLLEAVVAAKTARG